MQSGPGGRNYRMPMETIAARYAGAAGLEAPSYPAISGLPDLVGRMRCVTICYRQSLRAAC